MGVSFYSLPSGPRDRGNPRRAVTVQTTLKYWGMPSGPRLYREQYTVPVYLCAPRAYKQTADYCTKHSCKSRDTDVDEAREGSEVTCYVLVGRYTTTPPFHILYVFNQFLLVRYTHGYVQYVVPAAFPDFLAWPRRELILGAPPPAVSSPRTVRKKRSPRARGGPITHYNSNAERHKPGWGDEGEDSVFFLIAGWF